MTFAIAIMIASVAFGQRRNATNSLISEQNYKHPFAAKAAKENNIDRTEKFSTEKVTTCRTTNIHVAARMLRE